MKKLIPCVFAIAIMMVSCNQGTTEEEPLYLENFQSLSGHKASPDWFADAKLGIYFHWGVYSVPAFSSEWYPRNMHIEGHPVFNHHLETYGPLSEFGYHDFVPMFKAENFNAAEWAELFAKAGARFAGPVAEHHDGFSMWASEVTPWNVLNKGPKKDITGELEKAIKEQGMKFITTFHHARHLQRYDSMQIIPEDESFWMSHYPYYENMPPRSDDPELKYLYGKIPADEWHEKIWFGKLKEVIDNYQPDIIWFDSWLDLIPEEYRAKFAAYYLNEAAKWDKEVVIVRKQDDLPLSFSVDDLEKSRKNRLEESVWMTDETISKGSWCYTENLEIKPAEDVLHVLIDIVSKNGVLLLNISPKADGTIPEDQRKVLLKMGAWLDNYGEAIYETRPWFTHGEGPTIEPEGHFENHAEFLKIKYSWKDIRYTTKGNSIYAIFLGVPRGEEILLKSFSEFDKEIKKITVLNSGYQPEFIRNEKGLLIKGLKNLNEEMAVVLKMEL